MIVSSRRSFPGGGVPPTRMPSQRVSDNLPLKGKRLRLRAGDYVPQLKEGLGFHSSATLLVLP
jgi:hypothetical protein